MMNDHPRKIFGCGLPRCGGQSLQRALGILFPGQAIWHSPGSNWSHMSDKGPWLGAVEVFASPWWLEDKYPGSFYLFNTRGKEAWLQSCASVYSQRGTWNHPLWKYPLSQFDSYYSEYVQKFRRFQIDCKDRFSVIDITRNANWIELCAALRCNVPTHPFPRVDQFKDQLINTPTSPSDYWEPGLFLKDAV